MTRRGLADTSVFAATALLLDLPVVTHGDDFPVIDGLEVVRA